MTENILLTDCPFCGTTPEWQHFGRADAENMGLDSYIGLECCGRKIVRRKYEFNQESRLPKGKKYHIGNYYSVEDEAKKTIAEEWNMRAT